MVGRPYRKMKGWMTSHTRRRVASVSQSFPRKLDVTIGGGFISFKRLLPECSSNSAHLVREQIASSSV